MRALGARDARASYVMKACGGRRRRGSDDRRRRKRGGGARAVRTRRRRVLNTPVVVAKATADPRYRAEQNRKAPRKIGSKLVALRLHQLRQVRARLPQRRQLRLRDGACTGAELRATTSCARAPWWTCRAACSRSRKAHQIANFQDFCNECGNCDVFCPEDGGPYIEKPRFFGSLDAWRALPRDGFFACASADVDAAWGAHPRASSTTSRWTAPATARCSPTASITRRAEPQRAAASAGQRPRGHSGRAHASISRPTSTWPWRWTACSTRAGPTP